jgi:pimeloyl-ACP methyl ester carboxylesterase
MTASVQAAPLAVPKGLVWKQCVQHPPAKYAWAYKRLQCTSIKVPMNWKAPKGSKITLRISRVKATGKSKGVVFTNPGGPGAPGWETPLGMVVAKRAKLLAHLDIIGFDVRGTGYSTQLKCGNSYGQWLDARDRSQSNVAKLLAQTKRSAVACQKASGTFGKYVNTWQTVKDLDQIRRSLGQKKINWIGYSAGTWLGSHYARYFPRQTGRFVLDSNVVFTGTWQQSFDSQPRGFERRYREDFLAWAARNNNVYNMGATAAEVGQFYENFRAILAKEPVATEDAEGNRGWMYAQKFDGIIAQGLYTKYDFADLAAYMAEWGNALLNPARTTKKLVLPAFDEGAGEYATFDAIRCNDTAYKGGPADLVAHSAELGQAYPLVGWDTIEDDCVFWKRPAGTLKRPIGAGLPRLLMIQSEHDPATPYEGALLAHSKYENSRLVTVKGEGDHGIYAGDNPCVDKIVESYLVDGTYPAKDLSCAGAGIADARTAGGHNFLRLLTDIDESLHRQN